MLRALLSFVVIASPSGCALSHHAPSSYCAPGPLEEPSLDAPQREALLTRLRHEVTHLADAVSSIAEGRLAPTNEWRLEEDGGWMEVRGELVLGEAETVLTAEIELSHFTGGHGGWGLSALEGRACVTIVIAADGARTVEVSAVIGLVEDGPLQGAPMASVGYVEHAGDLEGAVGGVPIGD